MVVTKPDGIDRLAICRIQKFASKLVDNFVVKNIGDSRVRRTQDVVDIADIVFGDLADTIKTRASFGRGGARGNDLAVQFGKLLLAD